MANKKRKDKYDWWAAIIFWVIVIAFFGAILYSSMNRTEYVCIPVEESIAYYSSEVVGQVPEEVATILPGKEFVDYDWEAFLANSQTADLSSIKWGLGLLAGILIPLEAWNLKTTSSNKTAIAVIKDRQDRDKEV